MAVHISKLHSICMDTQT